MKKKGIISILIITCSVLLMACGTPLYELTSEEEDKIVEASAQIVSRYNIRQKDGMNWVELKEETQQPEESETEEQEEPDGNEQPNKGDGSGTEKEDISVSLAEALGYKGILSLEYTGLKVDTGLVQNGAMVTADNGNKLFILSLTMKNISQRKVELDFSKTDLKYTLAQDKETIGATKISFFSQDLTSYSGTLEEGQSVNVMLLFEVKEGNANRTSNLILKVKQKDNLYSVKL